MVELSAPRRRLRALALVQAALTLATLVALTAPALAATPPVPASPSNLPAAIESLQPYVGQKICDPVAKPGVRAFSNLILDTYPDTTSLGIVRDCGVGGQSEHKEGRAWDWGVSVSNANQKVEADTLLAWLLRTDSSGRKASAARRFGLMYVIWNRQIWKAYDPDRGWQAYSGADSHTTHAHFSFGWNGARMATSWWTGTVAPVDYGPSGRDPVTPVRVPENLLVLATYQNVVLKQGSADATATKVAQRALEIVVDGVYGADTTAAVRAFQTDQKLTVDGVVDTDVWQRLFPKPQVPFGKLETASFGIPGTVAVAGWAADADTLDPVRVHLYVDGVSVQALDAGGPRPDIEKLYPGMGPELGFTTALTLADGVHPVCAFAINVGPGGGNPSLGCVSVTVRHQPFGHADALTLVPGALVSSGWVYDPDTAAVVQVAHTVDGVPLVSVPAELPRTDVGSRYPTYGPDRGYATTVDLSTVSEGSHTLCAVATNLEAGTDLTLGCVTGTVRHLPFGAFDSLAQTPGGLQLTGWAIEPDTKDSAVLTPTIDGQAVPTFQAALLRSDVARLYPIDGPAHGFSTVVPLPTEGSHNVCLTVANVGTGTERSLGCRTVVVSHKPFGRFDVVTASAGRVTVQGWVIDPDTRDPVTVHVRIDGPLAGHTAASLLRGDVARYFPAYGGAHGYRYSPPTVLARGVHNVCVYAINTGAGSGNPSLGCRKITIA